MPRRDRSKTFKVPTIPTAPLSFSEEKTDIPGYLRVQYAFVEQSCGGILVDHYGPAINPNDKDLKQAEQRACVEIAMNTRDGD